MTARAERWEQDHVADRVPAGEQHRQTIDPEPEPARGGHPVRERLDVVRVAALALDVLRLRLEARALLLGVVDLRERVSELHPAGEVLEALGQRGVTVRQTGER